MDLHMDNQCEKNGKIKMIFPSFYNEVPNRYEALH
jgi:hypothetical protein